MNYFVAHATTNLFVRSAGGAPAFTAPIIGVPNVSAILVSAFHCWILSRDNLSHQSSCRNVVVIRRLFILSAFFGVIGNAFYAAAVIKDSILFASLGRLLFGFSATDILQLQVLGWCLQARVVYESAQFVQLRLSGVIFGLIVGSVAEAVPITINSVGVRAIQATSWLKMSLWFVHFVR